MDEELLKRNTDCIYFLASPLTCKKGIDCEYRHSDIARLNPRDCWYWLSGNCLNPTCAFRHPPLDGHAGAAPESAHGSTPVNKTNVPCYYYFNGFCNKGDRCSFMHGPDGNAPAGKPTKTASTSSDAPALENKTSAGSETGSAPAETHLIPSGSASKVVANLNFLPKQELQQPVPQILFQQNGSSQIAACEYDDAVIRSESFIPAEGFSQGISHISTDESSEEQMEDHIEPEERWESSPGFDVLVDDKSENLGYEDDPEYLLELDREHRELNSHFLLYDFKDLVECDTTDPDAELLCEHDVCDGFDYMDDEHLNGMDLRDHLRRRRVIDGHRITMSHLIDHGQKRPQGHGGMGQRLHRRLASEVGKNTIDSLRELGTRLNCANQHGLLRRSQQDRSKKHFKRIRLPKRHLSNEVLRKPIKRVRRSGQESTTFTGPKIKRERRSSQESTAFTGPKTLAQIKEEKTKAKANGDCIWKFENSGRTTLADFQGPKPLNEILKNKRRLDSVRDTEY